MKHLKLPCCIIVWFVISAFALKCEAQTSYAQGMVVYRATTSDGPEYFQGALFKSVRDVGAWFDFDVGQKSSLRVEKGLVVRIADFQVLDRRGNSASVFEMDVVSEQDVQTIVGVQNVLRDSAKGAPKLAATVKATCDVLDQQIAEYKAGKVRIGGRWTEKSAMSAVNSSPAALFIGGRRYSGARLMSAKDGVVTLAHDGGIAKVALASISAEERRRLAEVLHFDLATVGVAAPSNAPPASVPSQVPVVPVSPAINSAATPAVLEIDATGAGTSNDEALRDALRDAVRRAVGTFISAEQVVKNDELIRDQVVAHSDAFVQGYDKTSEKHDAGLFQVTIRARVVRSKLSEKLTATGLIGKAEVQGENMFAEALTKLDKANSAKELLTKLFTGFPQKFCVPQLIGKPTIMGQSDTTATLRFRVRIGVDPQAYATWYQEAASVLGQVCMKKQPFSISRVGFRDPDSVRERFQDKLYDEKPPTINDDPEIARFNPKLDGLVPVLEASYMGIQVPRVGLNLCVSRSSEGFNGYSYELGTDESSVVIDACKLPGKRGDEAWRKLDRVAVRFLNEAGELVRLETLDLTQRHIEGGEDWLAPYGALYGSSDEKLQLTNRPLYNNEHVMMIQPSFLLVRWTYASNAKDSSDAAIATSGVAFDFVLELPLEEIRAFKRVELSWPQE
ncbi:hypothetical protein [Prosthecobacter sp.]|uniref:hypothetical protein n=1 Tax=Prosthecobacter sp. TaxID=1965333 RepID=UPI001D50A215|nr:hypothetical protein [Prosthecobacter sp.]MCB1279053.1 hypothetical protein [Prosthecobacter sp.]